MGPVNDERSVSNVTGGERFRLDTNILAQAFEDTGEGNGG